MDELLFEEEREIRRIKDQNHKKSVNDLNRKNLTPDEMDEIFCDF